MQPITPDAHGVAVLLLTAAALFLFTRDRLPLETSSLAILIVLVAGFQLFPYESDGGPLGAVQFFAGFGNEALVAICALMMVGKALETTGALQPLAAIVGHAWSTRPLLALLVTLFAGAVLSAFMNNTPIVVLLMPILVGVSMRVKFPVSGVMLPMGLATIVGGMSTTIGTSTNLLVVGIAEDFEGLERFGMFDFVLPVAIVGALRSSSSGWLRRACCRTGCRHWPIRRHGFSTANSSSRKTGSLTANRYPKCSQKPTDRCGSTRSSEASRCSWQNCRL